MNDELKDKLKCWRLEPLLPDLSAQIVARAVQHKQITPWVTRLSRTVETALSDWSYGLSYKMASVILISATGLTLGIAAPQADSETIDIVSLALGIEQVEGS
jgi:hypothetical protein